MWANRWRKEGEETNGVVCVIGGGATVSALGTNEHGGLKVTKAMQCRHHSDKGVDTR